METGVATLGRDSGLLVLRMFFFFQAEDGIRDGTVTGVQTCALPISPARTGQVARENWITLPYLTGVMVLLTLVSIFHVWSRVEVIDLNLKISEAARQ